MDGWMDKDGQIDEMINEQNKLTDKLIQVVVIISCYLGS